eukprot:scaffold1560_cov177-Ochromonas_danica.AAC.9
MKQFTRSYWQSYKKRAFSSTTSTSTTSSGGSGGEEKRSILGPIVFTAISLTAAGLGVWQSQRYFWKVDLLKNLADRTKEDPIPWTSSTFVDFMTESVVTGEDALVGRRVILSGVYDFENELVLGLRAAPPGLVSEAAQGMGTNPQGYFIITPLKVHDKLTVFINRGWVPRTAKSWDQPQGTVLVTALVAEPEKGGYFAPTQDDNTKKLLWLEEKVLKSAVHRLNGSDVVWLFDAIADEGNDEQLYKDANGRWIPPIPKKIDLLSQMYVHPSTHLAYAFTWFSLSIAGFIMTYYKFRNPKAAAAIARAAASRGPATKN